MINGKSVLAIVPARGGSKGLPRKNIKLLGGKPLIAWTIEAALASLYIDRVILSSEDTEIIRTAEAWGCEIPFVRPSELAEDATPGIEPVLHALTEVPGYDFVVLLQPTSPLRLTQDIDACVELCAQEGGAVVSVVEAASNPYWMFTVNEENRLTSFLSSSEDYAQRQDLPKLVVPNGAVYAARTDWLLNSRAFLGPETVPYFMPRERSIDIDTEGDMVIAEFLLTRNQSVAHNE